MISDKIKTLFQFIEYLHSNIENFKQFDDLIKELEKLNYDRKNLKPEQNYKDRLQYDKIQAELESKFKILQDGTANLIKDKAKELNVCNPDKTETLWNRNISEIGKLKKEFKEKDLSTIFEHKNKYIHFRTETNHNYFSLGFFDDLDEILKELFDFFKESENENEFEKFESKEVKIDSVALMLKLIKEKRNPCKCELEFLTEKKLLCEDCNIRTEIENAITNQIEFQVKEQKEILTIKQFNNWLDNEISTIQNRIKKLSLQKLQCEKGEITIFRNVWNRTYIFNKESIKVFNKYETASDLKELQPQQIKKSKPELNEALISFTNTEIIESLHNELKGYFLGKEVELKKALQGEMLTEFLLFPHNQNKFVEVFKRLKYNNYLLSSPKETKNWICSNFNYQYQKGNKKEVREFNTSTVHDILTKDKGEPTKKERICIVDWLSYKSHLTRQREAEKENI